MPDLMADHPQQLVVCHRIHNTRVHAHAPVRAGEGVHFVLFVHLEIERGTVYVRDAFGQVPQTFGVGVALRQDGALGIQLGDVLVHVVLHLGVGQGKGLQGIHAALDSTKGVELPAAGSKQQGQGDD